MKRENSWLMQAALRLAGAAHSLLLWVMDPLDEDTDDRAGA